MLPVSSALSDLAPTLFKAVESFIHQNATFESSIVQKRVIDEVGSATDIMVAFAIPMQNTLLTMDGALRWVMFWRSAIDQDEMDAFPSDTFTADAAIRLISQVYDLGFQDAVSHHFEESDSEEDEGDESEAEGDEFDHPIGEVDGSFDGKTDVATIEGGADSTDAAVDGMDGADAANDSADAANAGADAATDGADAMNEEDQGLGFELDMIEDGV
jgi:hypothetical protein